MIVNSKTKMNIVQTEVLDIENLYESSTLVERGFSFAFTVGEKCVFIRKSRFSHSFELMGKSYNMYYYNDDVSGYIVTNATGDDVILESSESQKFIFSQFLRKKLPSEYISIQADEKNLVENIRSISEKDFAGIPSKIRGYLEEKLEIQDLLTLGNDDNELQNSRSPISQYMSNRFGLKRTEYQDTTMENILCSRYLPIFGFWEILYEYWLLSQKEYNVGNNVFDKYFFSRLDNCIIEEDLDPFDFDHIPF